MKHVRQRHTKKRGSKGHAKISVIEYPRVLHGGLYHEARHEFVSNAVGKWDAQVCAPKSKEPTRQGETQERGAEIDAVADPETRIPTFVLDGASKPTFAILRRRRRMR